ncbi:uncharacterized protein si:ch211-113e8.11 [Polyodon spathula]|uniref:uncharacterized protein si:ch211-113e8.11 n=1 Tax=Polyodon spathula TaxID=7913 RepID=UPI001B7E3981|nr:uncharacterized protein si:ch211-113e8.11 [Polyodon spathula]
MAALRSSLVGYGLSSGSESEGDAGTAPPPKRANNNAAKPGKNFLLESGDTSTDEDGSDPEPVPVPELLETQNNKLPAPRLGASAPGCSVFSNPFREERIEQLSVLQRHVPLTLQPKPALIGGRKVCLLYRQQGRCRFGHNCKFAHDSELQTPVPSPAGSTQTPAAESAEHRDCAEPGQPRTGKRKPGLSDTLVPPKRSMKNYQAQRAREHYSQLFY